MTFLKLTACPRGGCYGVVRSPAPGESVQCECGATVVGSETPKTTDDLVREAVAVAIARLCGEIANEIEFAAGLHSDPYVGPFGMQMAAQIRGKETP